MQYDVTLKDLIMSGAPALLRQLAGAPAVEVLGTEYPAIRNRHPDFVARLADGRLYHLELQSAPDRRMAWRMLEYYALIAERHDGAGVLQQVLMVGERRGAIGNGIAHPNLTFRYDVLDIRAIDPLPLLDSPAVEDNVLAFLCRCDDLRGRVREIVERLCRREPAERDAAAVRLLILSGLRDAERLVLEEMRPMPIQIDLDQNPYFSEILRRSRSEGRAEGRAESLLRLLEHRFGPVPPVTRERVVKADIGTLDLWFDRAMEAASLEAVFAPPPAH